MVITRSLFLKTIQSHFIAFKKAMPYALRDRQRLICILRKKNSQVEYIIEFN